MGKRVVLLFALLGLSPPVDAAGPFGGRWPWQRASPDRPTPASPYRHLIDSPKELTARFGPSILVREANPVAAKKRDGAKGQPDSRFVTQPQDTLSRTRPVAQ